MINHPNRSKTRKAKAVTVTTVETIAPVEHNHDYDHQYADLLTVIQTSFDQALVRADGAPLFETDADGDELYASYLAGFPNQEMRQHHTCHACKRFIQSFGGLVYITPQGIAAPAMWSLAEVPDLFHASIETMHNKVARARVTGPFYVEKTVLGQPVTGKWTHIAVNGARVFKHPLHTPYQAMAEKRQDVANVRAALVDFSPAVIDEAINLLRGEHLSQSQMFIGPLEWLRNLHNRPKGKPGENILWRAVATAPPGYCHPRSAVTGTLIEDIKAGMPFDDIRRRFEEKVHPLRYQRPQAPPSAGNIAAAEAVVETLGIAPSLERRFARLDEVEAIWRPKEAAPAETSGGVFGHLTPKGAEPAQQIQTPSQLMTWEKFARTALPGAEVLEVSVPSHGPFTALTTATHADAPPIMKWDREDRRNPFCWYVYPGGSPASQWSLRPGWSRVTAVIQNPAIWHDPTNEHLGSGCVLAIDGAMDTHENSGNGLFPQCLRQELHPIRATIESYSRRAKLSGREGALASGLRVPKGAIGYMLRVTAGGRTSVYTIDRWD